MSHDDLEAVERQQPSLDHDHDGITGEDGTLAVHLHQVHRVEVAQNMSAATQEGLHDRLHDSSHASDD